MIRWKYRWCDRMVPLPKYLYILARRFWHIKKNRWLRRRMAGMTGTLANGVKWELCLTEPGAPYDKEQCSLVLFFHAPGLSRRAGAAVLRPTMFDVGALEDTFKNHLWGVNWSLAQANLAMAEPDDPDGFFVKWDSTAKKRFRYDHEKEEEES